jgi:hypothetical protein
LDPDPIRSVDPDPDPDSESGFRIRIQIKCGLALRYDPNGIIKGNTKDRAMAFTSICQQFFVRTILALIFNTGPLPLLLILGLSIHGFTGLGFTYITKVVPFLP